MVAPLRPPLTPSTLPMAPNDLRVQRIPPLSLPGDLPPAPNTQRLRMEILAAGGHWIPSGDPLFIGPNNFAVLRNLRYRDTVLHSVRGYSKITPTALTTTPLIRSGIFFVKFIDGVRTPHLLVQAWESGMTTYDILEHRASPPAPGAFEAQALASASGTTQIGRFSLAPQGTVAFCDGQTAMIWGSREHPVNAFLVQNATEAVKRDYSEAVRNRTNTAVAELALTVGGLPAAPVLLIGSSRPLRAWKVYVETPNTAPASLSAVEYWGSSGWTASTFTDTTVSGSSALAQTGDITLTSAAAIQLANHRVKIEGEFALYFYRMTYNAPVSAGTSLRHVTVNAPWQPVRDVWDGIYRLPILAQVWTTFVWKDYTLEIQEESFATTAVSMSLNSLAPGGYVLLGFETRHMAIRWNMIADQDNSTAATATVSYWNGETWTAVANLVDGTREGTASLGRTGIMSWTPPDPADEFPQTLFGATGFFYKIQWDATLDSTVQVDTLAGIPAPRTDLAGFRFPFTFADRLFLMGDVGRGELHAAEFSARLTPDVWNGADSSDQGHRLYFGETGALTAAAHVFNRFAGTLTEFAVVTKADETWLLLGNAPENFQIFPISQTLGCPAPFTMTTADLNFSVADDAQRHVALWISSQGPILFDGGTLTPIPGIEPYFDPQDRRFLTTAALANAYAWFDPDEREWNVLLPTDGSTTLTTWLVFDVRRQRWFEKVPTAMPQAVIPVTDADGRSYAYAGLDTGLVMRLEDTTTWDGDPISVTVESADLLPTRSVLDLTRVTSVFALVFSTDTDQLLTLTHIGDGSLTETRIGSISTATTNRYTFGSFATNLQARSHQLRLTADSTAALSLGGYGLEADIIRVERP